MTAIRRFALLVITMMLVLGTIICVPPSYSDTKTVEKDTSWFDYEHPKDHYTISTEAQLMGLRSLVNEEQVDVWKPTRLENFKGVTFTLSRDIKLTEKWVPIGRDSSSYFAGTFDGAGHTISNVNVDSSFGNSGFFGYLVGEVKELNIEGKNTSEDGNVGGLVGTLAQTGRIINCTSHMNVTGKDKTGGIVGNNEGGLIEGCINFGNVNGTIKVGGVVGENWGGTVSESGNRGNVTSSYRGVATYGTGGVAGRSVSSSAVIRECYNVGDILSNTEATGGVVGYVNATGSVVRDCYNIGSIVIKRQNKGANITGSSAGGVVGTAGIYSVEIRNCYNAGTIQNADIEGGVIGHYINATDEIVDKVYVHNNYYISRAFNAGIGKIDDSRDPNLEKTVKGVSDTKMHTMASSLSMAYMKDSGSYGNDGYPVLKWQQPIVETEREYFDVIPVRVQKNLDDYLVDTAGDERYGEIVMNLMDVRNLTTNAFILYMEAQDKIEEQKKDNNEQRENDRTE